VIHPEAVVEAIERITKGTKRVICTEVGQNQMWACQYTRITEPRGWVSSGGLGTMGYGLPAAMGAKVGRPDCLVIDIAGDGSIQMNSQEMATCKINDIPVKVVVLNNGYLGMVRQWQELFYGVRYASSVLDQDCPDFVKLGEAYGWLGLRVTEPAKLEETLKQAFEHEGPAIVDVRVVREENVFPMVAPGGSIDEMLGGVPGAPVSEMLDDDLLEEVWE
jgi:acetolactate synthase I/II/III large subunit